MVVFAEYLKMFRIWDESVLGIDLLFREALADVLQLWHELAFVETSLHCRAKRLAILTSEGFAVNPYFRLRHFRPKVQGEQAHPLHH